MENLKKLLGTGITFLFLSAFVLLGLKNCVGTVYQTSEIPVAYTALAKDEKWMGLYFLPGNQMILDYHDDLKKEEEATLVKLRGSYGTHYFGRLWKTDESIWSIRVVPENTVPVIGEIECIGKYTKTPERPVFPGKGSNNNATIYIGDKMVRFQNLDFFRDTLEVESRVTILKALIEN